MAKAKKSASVAKKSAKKSKSSVRTGSAHLRLDVSSQIDNQHDALVVFLEKFKSSGKDSKPSYNFERTVNPIKDELQSYVSKNELSVGFKDVHVFRTLKDNSSIILVGLGESASFTLEHLRTLGAEVKKTIDRIKALKVAVCFDDLSAMPKFGTKEFSAAFAEGIRLASYKFDDFKSKKDTSAKHPVIDFVTTTSAQETAVGVKEAELLSECINFAKRLGDTPGNLMTPSILAQETLKAAKGTGLKVDIWGKDKIKKEKFGGLLGVSLGSSAEPKFIALEYKGGKNKKPICFVGKGLTFDSGGISIKPAAQMDEMKFDMCGGANVIATMLAIAKLKIPVNAIAFVPATENMPGPLANKPGDILVARNGVTVEVQNTDAEGRLILMDALAFATEKKPAMIVDAATLTGAMLIALGNIHTGYFTKDDEFSKRIEMAAKNSGEQIWRLPMTDDHLKDMKGSYSDLQNISAGRGAGSATAAAFLSQFVADDIPWAHFDIAGTAWNCGNRLSYAPSKGATGVMIRTFVELAKQYS